MNQRWLPRNGCDGRLMAKSLITPIQVKSTFSLVLILTLKPARKYKQISTENAQANTLAFPQCLEQSAITLKRLSPQLRNLCQ